MKKFVDIAIDVGMKYVEKYCHIRINGMVHTRQLTLKLN